METSGQLYLSPALVTIPARLPHCLERNSSFSWCWWGWQGELGLVGKGWVGVWLCRGSEGGEVPTLPRDILRGWQGPARLCRGLVVLFCLAAPGIYQGFPVLGKRSRQVAVAGG